MRGADIAKSIGIPSSVTLIGARCFDSCPALRAVSFRGDSRLTTIEEGAFGFAAQLESIKFPASLEVIGKGSFMGCRNLRRVSFCTDSRLTTIEEGAFQFAAQLESIKFPASLAVQETHTYFLSSRSPRVGFRISRLRNRVATDQRRRLSQRFYPSPEGKPLPSQFSFGKVRSIGHPVGCLSQSLKLPLKDTRGTISSDAAVLSRVRPVVSHDS
jgi:hypothetical protein